MTIINDKTLWWNIAKCYNTQHLMKIEEEMQLNKLWNVRKLLIEGTKDQYLFNSNGNIKPGKEKILNSRKEALKHFNAHYRV